LDIALLFCWSGRVLSKVALGWLVPALKTVFGVCFSKERGFGNGQC
jgi:hypothetical protein